MRMYAQVRIRPGSTWTRLPDPQRDRRTSRTCAEVGPGSHMLNNSYVIQ